MESTKRILPETAEIILEDLQEGVYTREQILSAYENIGLTDRILTMLENNTYFKNGKKDIQESAEEAEEQEVVEEEQEVTSQDLLKDALENIDTIQETIIPRLDLEQAKELYEQLGDHIKYLEMQNYQSTVSEETEGIVQDIGEFFKTCTRPMTATEYDKKKAIGTSTVSVYWLFISWHKDKYNEDVEDCICISQRTFTSHLRELGYEKGKGRCMAKYLAKRESDKQQVFYHIVPCIADKKLKDRVIYNLELLQNWSEKPMIDYLQSAFNLPTWCAKALDDGEQLNSSDIAEQGEQLNS